MTMISYRYLLVSDADLGELAAGRVPRKLRRRTARLIEDLAARLRRNARKPNTAPTLEARKADV